MMSGIWRVQRKESGEERGKIKVQRMHIERIMLSKHDAGNEEGKISPNAPLI